MATPAILLLEGEAPFVGVSAGAEATARGVMAASALVAGHLDLLTDPAYAGKIVCFAYPHICNSGVVPDDLQSDGVHAAAAVAREFSRFAANRLGVETITDFFIRHGIPAVEGVDTRSVIEIAARRGIVRAVVGTGTFADADALAKTFADEWPAPATGTDAAYDVKSGGKGRVVVLDLGVKKGFLRRLAAMGVAVRILPVTATAEQVLAEKPDGVVVSSGAGVPAARVSMHPVLTALAGAVPLWGVGLGAGVLAESLGAATTLGGHIGIFAVGRDGEPSGEMTSQCRDFLVDAASLEKAGLVRTHFNLNDGAVEGFACAKRKIMGTLFYPEAEPGPRDSLYLFDRFHEMMRK